MKNFKINKKLRKQFENWKEKKYAENKFKPGKTVHDLLWEHEGDCKAVYLFLKQVFGITEDHINSYNTSQDENSKEIIQFFSAEINGKEVTFIQEHFGGDYRGNYGSAIPFDATYEDVMCSYDKEEEKDEFERMAELESLLEVEICSYGLMPNPSGYCYELPSFKTKKEEREWFKEFSEEIKELDSLCDSAPKGYIS